MTTPGGVAPEVLAVGMKSHAEHVAVASGCN
jgi:hypothetical protein